MRKSIEYASVFKKSAKRTKKTKNRAPVTVDKIASECYHITVNATTESSTGTPVPRECAVGESAWTKHSEVAPERQEEAFAVEPDGAPVTENGHRPQSGALRRKIGGTACKRPIKGLCALFLLPR